MSQALLQDDECEASSLHGGDGSDEEGDEAGGKFVVDDGYLSGDEGVRMEDDEGRSHMQV
jgi:hypothetical protein